MKTSVHTFDEAVKTPAYKRFAARWAYETAHELWQSGALDADTARFLADIGELSNGRCRVERLHVVDAPQKKFRSALGKLQQCGAIRDARYSFRGDDAVELSCTFTWLDGNHFGEWVRA